MHRDWNKLPYHTILPEHSAQDEANKICKQAINREPVKSFGRLFILGNNKKAQPDIYICSKRKAEPFAYSFSQLVAAAQLPYDTLSNFSSPSASSDDSISGIMMPIQLENVETAEHLFFFILDVTSTISDALKKHELKYTNLYEDTRIQLGRLLKKNNNYIDEFIKYYNIKTNKNKRSSIDFESLNALTVSFKHAFFKEPKLFNLIQKIKNFETIRDHKIRAIVKQKAIELANGKHGNNPAIQLFYGTGLENSSPTEQLSTTDE